MQSRRKKILRLSAIWVLALLTASGEGMKSGATMRRAHAQPPRTTAYCTLDDLCLEVVHLGTLPVESRILVVSWLPLSDIKADDDDENIEPMPTIAYAAPVPADAKLLRIPLSEISKPDDAHAKCDRNCTSEGVCGCADERKMALAYVALVRDPNADGKIEQSELIDADVEGLASVVIAFGQQTMFKSESGAMRTESAWLTDVMTATPDTQVRAFRWISGHKKGPDHLEALSSSSKAELFTCAFGDTQCELRFPNLM